MGQHNDSINQHIGKPVHDAMHETTMAIIDCLKAAGCDVASRIDFKPSTGEVIMSPRTVKAIRDFQRQLKEKNIVIDKVMHKDNLETSGYYVIQGREITPGGVILSEGTCIGFVQVTPVETAIPSKDAVGVLV